MSERARGRARGRARTTEEQVRRPGEQTQYEEQTAAASSSSSSHAPFAGGAPTTVAGSGRASYRGGVREPRPGAGDAPRRPADDANRRPADDANRRPADVAPLRLGTGDASNVKRRRQDFSYDEPALKPAHTTEKRGTVGQQIPLKTNFFKLESVADWKLYQYHVDFNPPLDSKKLRIALLYTHSELLGATKVFDGMILFLPKKLPNVETEVFSQTRTGENIRISIKLTNELPPTSPQCLHAYNVIFRKVLQMMEMQEIGRNYYNMKQVKEIPEHHLRVAPGFSTSILQYENQSLLCADVSHKVFRTDTVLDMMYEMHSRGNPTFHEDCRKLLVGSTVLTRYNNKTYRVDDIEWSARPTDTFKLRKGDNITYCEYYRRSYDIILEDMEQPMLVSRPSKKDIKMGRTEPIFLLPELCILTGLSDEMRKDHRVMKDVAVYTRLGPEARCRDLSDFIRQINAKKDIQQYMGGWGLKFSSTLLLLNGRILPKEKITLCNDAECMFNPNEPDWTKDLRGKQFLTSVNINSWVLLYFHKNAGSAQDLCQALSRVGPPMGMRMDRPNICELRDDRTESYIRGIRQTVGPRTQLVLALLPNNRKDRYDAIKKECCVNLPVPSQCVLVKNMFKNLMSIATKIAIQLNCKLGGEIWKCEIPLNKLMIIGLDTYHDSSKKGRSVGGVVASINKNCTRFYSRTTFQPSAQELNDGLQVCVTDAINKYQAENKVLPDKIILYRDGVGDGQLPAVYEHEVSQLTTTIQKAAGPDLNIKLAVVVVKKRINSRFFARGGRGDHANPVPGTVVDTEVTKPQWFDFFLISQSVRQGTVSPTHYNVIWDTTGMKPDHHQRLAYKMCHMYYNWPGTIRVPAPCQYAHKLAFLVGQSIHREPALDLSDRLYYL